MNSINNFIVFIHIEKTAGTTFNYFLRNNIPSYKTLNNPIFWSEKYQGMFTTEMFQKLIKFFPNIKGIGGHTLRPYFDYESCINDKKVSYITFLRDPINRYLSHYNYQNTIMRKNWKLEEFIENKEFSNFQTKKIVGYDDIDKAKSILKNDFDFVGITEYFNESIQLLTEKFPLVLKYNYFNNKNVANKSNFKYQHLSEISNELIEKIKKQNASDLVLYEFVATELLLPNLKKYSVHKDIVNINNNNNFLRRSIFTIKSLFLKFHKIIFEKMIVRYLY